MFSIAVCAFGFVLGFFMSHVIIRKRFHPIIKIRIEQAQTGKDLTVIYCMRMLIRHKDGSREWYTMETKKGV